MINFKNSDFVFNNFSVILKLTIYRPLFAVYCLFFSMTKDKWLNLLDTVEARFTVEKNCKEPLGDDIPGEKWLVEFSDPHLGRVRLEWVEKARTVDEKTVYSHRAGGAVKVYKVYDEEEKVCFLNVYRWNDASAEWDKIDSDLFAV